MASPGAAKVGMLMGFGGMGAMFMGFLNIPGIWRQVTDLDLLLATLVGFSL